MAAFRRLLLGAMLCATFGTPALAQATLDFIDPLDNERVRIEERTASPEARPAPREAPSRAVSPAPSAREADTLLTRARDGAASGADAARQGAGGFWASLRGSISAIAATLGISALALVALLLLLLAGIAMLVGWTLFRGRNSKRRMMPGGDVRAKSAREALKRRAMGSPIQPKPAPAPAAPVPVETSRDADDTYPEEFDAIFAEEGGTFASKDGKDSRAKVADPDEWRKPNLDRLRDSIKADWKADKEERTDKARAKPEKGVAAPVSISALAARGSASADPGARKLDELSDGWEEWDAQDKPEDDPWGETLPDSAPKDAENGYDKAADRIRALRESLRAS